MSKETQAAWREDLERRCQDHLTEVLSHTATQEEIRERALVGLQTEIGAIERAEALDQLANNFYCDHCGNYVDTPMHAHGCPVGRGELRDSIGQ